MRRFIVFAGNDIADANGGFFDFKGDFETLEGAKRSVNFDKVAWAHIFDTKTKAIIMAGTFEKGLEKCRIGLRGIVSR